LAALVPQLGSADELVVVDDDSTDATAAVAAAGGAQVVVAGARPEGWLGKSWACRRGVAATTAPVLVFVDADVTPADGALEAIVGAVRSSGGLVSVQPWHRTERPYEALSALCNVVAWMGTGAATPLGARLAPRMAFGPVLAMERSTYERIGGHEAVRSSVAEDIALAARLRSAQPPVPVTLAGGRALATFRMYPLGPRSLLDGWSKNLTAGVRAVRWWIVLAVAAWIASLAGGWAASPWFVLASALQVGVLVRRVGRFGAWCGLVYPVLVLVFVAMVLRSAWVRLRGTAVNWKGRPVPAR
jgi:4,4'-diaponeurosporenoate glycosyltransferase